MKEKWLLHKIRHGDMAALDTFITQVYPTIYAFVYRKMQGDDSAKDITQEVFLRFIRYLPTYHEEGKVIHFLYRIASNLCVDAYRKQKLHLMEDSEAWMNGLGDDIDVHESILKQCAQETLLYNIGKLPLPQQDVILLHYFHQLTYREIAQVYDMPISSVKSRRKAALAKLYQMMKGERQDENR